MSPLAHPIPAEWLMAFDDGELDPARRELVAAHLAECAECRRELEDLHALSQVLASDQLPQEGLTGAAVFWSGVQAQLPDRRSARAAPPARATVSARGALLRWSPGIGLLLLNGAVQVAAAAGTVLLFLASPLSGAPTWVVWLVHWAAGAPLGWLAWVLPSNWSGLALFLFWMSVSAELAVMYLAWLGYELRYGARSGFGRVTALIGD